MSDNNEPVDLEAIEARLIGFTNNRAIRLSVITTDRDLANIIDWIDKGPTDIAALIAEIKRLRADYTKHTANLNNIIDSNHREILQLQKELAEAKRTQVKNGGRMRLRPFPEPGEMEL